MNTRIRIFDYVRILAMFLVICLHSWDSIKTFGPTNGVGLIYDALDRLFSLGVPLFFALSGALLLREDCKDFLLFYKKRSIAIIIPMLIYSSVYVLYADYETNSLSVQTLGHYFQKLICGQVHATWWFIYTILAIYLITPFIAKMLSSLSNFQKKLLLYILFSYMIISAFLSLFGWEFGISGILFSTSSWLPFILGYFGFYFGQKALDKKKIIILCLCSAIMLVIYLLGYDQMDILRNSVILISFSLRHSHKSRSHDNSIADKFIGNLANKSYGIYLIHAAVLSLLLKLYTTWDSYIYGKLILLVTAVAGLSYIISFLADKIIIERIQNLLRKKLNI